MQVFELNELQTIVIGLAALGFGGWLMKRIPFLGKCNVPTPVLARVLASLCVWAVRRFWDVEVRFGTKLTDFMLLVFFTSVGLSAKLSALKAGGKPLLILCAATVLLIVAQNFAGIAVTMEFGANPYYSVLISSISFVDNPNTTTT